MNYPFQARIEFSKVSKSKYSEVVGKIIKSLNDNAGDFPALPVPTGTLTTQIAAYNSILTKPVYLAKAADLAAARKTMDTSLRRNGVYVNTVAGGNLSLLERSGYPVSKPRFPVGALAQTKINATAHLDGDSPGFDIDITRVDGARGYLVLYLPVASITPAITSPHQWNWVYFSKSTGRLMGLSSATSYRLISVALGTNKTMNFSNPIERTTN